MTWLVWRQYRVQAAIAAALLAAFALVLLVAWVPMASQWHSALSACTADHSCAALLDSLSLGNHAAYDLTILSLIVPGVIGLLISTPAIAGEVEAGTGNFVWTQSVTRGRWLLAKAGWLLLAAAVWGGCLAALVTWWSGPRNALYGNAMQPNDFDMQGIVPVGYAVFALALGLAAGALLRRRAGHRRHPGRVHRGPHAGRRGLPRPLSDAVTTYYGLSGATTPASGWSRARQRRRRQGRSRPRRAGYHRELRRCAKRRRGPAGERHARRCKALVPDVGWVSAVRGEPFGVALHVGRLVGCLQSAGNRQFATYQPMRRFSAMQSIKTAISWRSRRR